jgi:hypothetical protein
MAGSPPGLVLSVPLRVWQLAQAWAKIVLPCCGCVFLLVLCPPQAQRRRVRAAVSAGGRRRLAHVVGVAE